MRHFALILALASAAGCSVGAGQGSVIGTLWMNQCTQWMAIGSPSTPAAFDLHAGYFVALPTNETQMLQPQNHLTIRVQSAGTKIEESDLVNFSVEDVVPVAQALGQPIPVGPDTNVRATLGLFRSCPQHTVQLELDGTITFSKFGVTDPASTVPPTFHIQLGDPLDAVFSFDIVDRRALTLAGVGAVPAQPQAGGQIAGSFNFNVTQGRAAQPF